MAARQAKAQAAEEEEEEEEEAPVLWREGRGGCVRGAADGDRRRPQPPSLWLCGAGEVKGSGLHFGGDLVQSIVRLLSLPGSSTRETR